MSISMSCGCLTYPCLHSSQLGMAQMQHQGYLEQLMRNYQGMQEAAPPKEETKKRNKKLLILRK